MRTFVGVMMSTSGHASCSSGTTPDGFMREDLAQALKPETCRGDLANDGRKPSFRCRLCEVSAVVSVLLICAEVCGSREFDVHCSAGQVYYRFEINK